SMVTAGWWKSSFRCVWRFAPHCVMPAVFWMICSLTVIVATDVSMESLHRQSIELQDLIISGAVLLFGLVLSLSFFVMGFGSWIVRLTAYCKFLLDNAEASGATDAELLDKQSGALTAAKERRGYVWGALFWASLFMLIPFFVLVAVICVKVASIRQVMGPLTINLDIGVNLVLFAIGLPLFIALLVYSFVVLAAAAVSNQSPSNCAKQSLSLSFSLFLPLSAVIIIFAIINVVIGTPADLPQLLRPELILEKRNVYLTALSQVWQGVVSIVLFPLSLTPVCEILRGRIR
ncbi:MAG TPA: hypothetical protein V6D17_11805, partial [Candidatus Obscuribacterales bacterium]